MKRETGLISDCTYNSKEKRGEKKREGVGWREGGGRGESKQCKHRARQLKEKDNEFV